MFMILSGYNFPNDLLALVDLDKKKVDLGLYWQYPHAFLNEKSVVDKKFVFVKNTIEEFLDFLNENNPALFKGSFVIDSEFKSRIPESWKNKVYAFCIKDSRENTKLVFEIDGDPSVLKTLKSLHNYSIVENYKENKSCACSVLLYAIYKLGHYDNSHNCKKIIKRCVLTPFHTLIISNI